MSVYLLLRLSVMLVAGFVGSELGAVLARHWPALQQAPLDTDALRAIAALVVAALGFVLAPTLVLTPSRAIGRQLKDMPARTMTMGVVGMTLGLVVAALLAMPLSALPGIWGEVLPLTGAVLLGTLGATVVMGRDRDLLALVGLALGRDAITRRRRVILLDTSVIIDGRIADICETGFVGGVLWVPRFVLDELQHIADSADPLRRRRGRRGLDVLERLQKSTQAALEISDVDPAGIQDVDAKLVAIAQEYGCAILTNDYNLNRVAGLQKIKVLNVNELANAVKAVVLPGEALTVQIIQEGKELGQGVGYLDDGTMVVVEDGRRLINTTCDVMVTRVLQTVAGKMIFAQLPARQATKDSQ